MNSCGIDWTAIGTMILAVVGIVSIIFLAATRKATVDSARATRTQNALLEAQMMAATRPILVLVSRGTAYPSIYVVHNQGPGAAHAIRWWYGNGPKPEHADVMFLDGLLVLGSGQECPIDLNPTSCASMGITLHYLANDRDKTAYMTLVQLKEKSLFQQPIKAQTADAT